MLKNLDPSAGGFRLGLAGPYLKRAGGVILGLMLILAFFFYALKNNKAPATVEPTNDQCICPNCGIAIQRPPNLDCEEVSCPNCGGKMDTAATLAGSIGNQGIGPLQSSPNQKDAFTGQIIAMSPVAQSPAFFQESPQPGAAETAPPLSGPGTCICPNCGWKLARQPGFYCSRMRCPNCQSPMTNSIPIGTAKQSSTAGDSSYTGPTSSGAAASPVDRSWISSQGQSPSAGALPSLTPPSGGLLAQDGSFLQVASPAIGYSNTVQPIVAKNCLRCHGGPMRNLSGYTQLKSYADSGLLMMMIQPGGPMSRFLTAEESDQITSWIKSGAPQ